MNTPLFRGLTRRPPDAATRFEAARGRNFARAWRARMKPFFDAIYGLERAASGTPLSQSEEAKRGRAFAARWRRECPYGALLDSLYGKESPR